NQVNVHSLSFAETLLFLLDHIKGYISFFTLTKRMMEKRDFKPDIRYYYSEINNRLKVVEREGKKLLDTKDTNYSFGGLQKVLEFGLDLVPLAEFESVLVLGMGAGSIVDSLRNNSSFFGKITGVEIDPVVIEIAENEFDLFADKNLQVVQQDASAYVKEADQL